MSMNLAGNHCILIVHVWRVPHIQLARQFIGDQCQAQFKLEMFHLCSLVFTFNIYTKFLNMSFINICMIDTDGAWVNEFWKLASKFRLRVWSSACMLHHHIYLVTQLSYHLFWICMHYLTKYLKYKYNMKVVTVHTFNYVNTEWISVQLGFHRSLAKTVKQI
jgi:hypothetical protein